MSLHLVVGEKNCLHYSIETVVSKAVKGGVTHVQLREKFAAKDQIIETGLFLKSLLKSYNIPLIINDHVDIALAIDADGVHLGQSDMSYLEARRLLGAHKVIGLTIETSTQMAQANQWDVQYVGIGPVFATQSKLDAAEPLGISGLTFFCKISRHPVVAIGGIHADNASAVLNAGAKGIAVVSSICHTRYPQDISHRLKQIFIKRRT